MFDSVYPVSVFLCPPNLRLVEHPWDIFFLLHTLRQFVGYVNFPMYIEF